MYDKPILSIVLGSYNRLNFLRATLESVRKDVQNISHEIIVVDGGSTDGSVHFLAKQKDVITIIQHNRGKWRGKPVERRSWGYFMNLGFKASQGKYILMISDDCLIVPGAVSNGISLFEQRIANGENIGAMAFYWRNWPDQKDYWVGITFGQKMFVNHGLYLRSALETVNWLDEDSYTFYHADGDVSLKLWENNFQVIESPDSYIEHFRHSITKIRQSNFEKQQTDWTNYITRWKNEDENFIGDWITKNHNDEFMTYRQFPILSRLKAISILEIQKIKRLIKKLLNRFYKTEKFKILD